MSEFLNETLMQAGYSALPVNDKNVIIAQIADELGVEYNKVTDANILDYHKRLKVGHFSIKCDQTIAQGFTASNGHFYRTNRDDQVFLIGQKFELIDDATVTEVSWKTQDADYVVHTREEWLKVYKEAFLHVRTQLFKYDKLKQAVLKAESHDEIIALKWL